MSRSKLSESAKVLSTMSQIEQARKLGLLYAELASAGEEAYFERLNRVDMGWYKPTNTYPNLNSDLSLWRVAKPPAKKIIDLSVCIESDIDMEFSDVSIFWKINKLIDINSKADRKYIDDCSNAYHLCRVRGNHWHSWGGGKCPLPEGLKVHVQIRKGGVIPFDSTCNVNWKYHDELMTDYDVIAFRVLGVDDGWRYEWQKDD